uniref:General transcription factor 3C polypeptide 3 n=2 Tax=Plectus sambesii TaxID=2011161 RepID=A0A914W3B1_9BILA
MWMRLGGRYKEAAQAVFIHAAGDLDALDAVGEPAVLVVSNPTGPGYTVADPFPPDTVHEYRVSDRLPTSLLARVIVCFIRLSRWDLAEPLLTEMNKRESSSTCEESYLEVARAFQATNALELAQKFGENLLGQDVFADSPAVWLAYADILHDRRKLQPAVDAFKRVVELAPTHVDARIKLSTLQQELGMPDQALDTLRDYDLDECTELPDERLLQRQADMLFTRKLHDQFARCARMLVTPYFFEIHRLALDRVRRERSIAGNVSMLLRTAAMDALRGSPLERFVKRMGPGAVDRQRVLNADQLHDYCLKLVEVLFSKQLYSEMLSVCCYAYMQPMLTSSGRTRTFDGLLLLAAIKAQAWNVAFEYLRGVQAPLENRSNRLWNAFNAVFVNFQDMRYHRYIMRALYKEPGNLALTTLSGNNSLISGSYRHALGEYLRVWQKLPDDPLICLLLGLTFVHMASKKDVSKRHQVALRGVAFLNKYERARGVKQEVWYNLGRAFHQLNILYAAVHFYKKVFDSEAPPVVRYDEETGEMKREIAEEYDLKPLAAHNLALIYQTSGNRHLARQVLEKYCIV